MLEGDSDVAAGSEAWDRLAEFVERDPEVAGAFRFRHALIRDAAYEGLSFKRRRELHGRVAEVIEAHQGERPEEAAELLSLHYFNAGRWDEAWKYSCLAGDLAREVYANVDAAKFYERALEESGKVSGLADGELARAWRSLGEVRDAAGDYRGAVEALKVAARLLMESPVARAEALLKRALAWARLGAYSAALRDTTAGLASVKSVETADARHSSNSLLALRAQILLQQGRPRDAIAIASEVVRDAEPLGPSRALAQAYDALDGAYFELGQPEKAVHEIKALEIYREIGAARGAAVIASNLGVSAYAEGRWREATEYYSHSRDELERLGDVTQAAFASANIGEVLISRRLLEEAETVLDDARTTLRAAEHVTGSIFAETQLARLALVREDFDAAVEDLGRIVDEAVAVGSAPFALEAWIYLAEAYARRGESARAVDTLDDAERTLGLESSPLAAHLARVRAVALGQIGESTAALEQAELAIEIARRRRLLYEEEQALGVIADLLTASGEEARAREALEEAESLSQRLAEMS